MFAIIAIFLPAVIMSLLWDRLFYEGVIEKKRIIIEYALFLLLINAIDIFVISYIMRSPGDIVGYINEYSTFALKYIMLSCLLAVVIPYAAKYCKTNLRIECAIAARPEWKAAADRLYRPLAVIYTLILFILNFIRIFDNNLWGDECFSVMLSQMNVQDMLETTAGDVHPPLYYLFVIASNRVFGARGWAYHLVSLIPYTIGLVFILTVIWKRLGRETAILMVTFTSVMRLAVVYNVEVRMYSWAALFVLLAYYALYLIILDGKKQAYVFFVLASLGAAYTHYYALLSVAFFYLALLVMAIKKRIRFSNVIVVYLLTIIGYLPWLVSMIASFIRTSKSWWLTDEPDFLDSMLYFFSASQQWYAALMLVLTAALFVILVIRDTKVIEAIQKDGKIIVRISKGREGLSDTCFWMLWGIIASVGTVAVGVLISVFVRPIFISRYLYPVTIVVWLVLSVGATRFSLRKVVAPVILVITLVVCVPTYGYIYQAEKATNEECKATAQYMDQAISETDVILTNGSHLAWTILTYYLPNVSYRLISADFTEFDPEAIYWLVWTEDLTETDLVWLDRCGYGSTETYHDGVLGVNSVHVYQLYKK